MRNQKGYSLLISVILIGAIGSAIAVSVVTQSALNTQNSISAYRLLLSRFNANGCAEEALLLIKNTPGFTGSGSLNSGYGSCTYLVENTGGQTRSIKSEGLSGNAHRKILVTISSVNPNITVSSWKEVADY